MNSLPHPSFDECLRIAIGRRRVGRSLVAERCHDCRRCARNCWPNGWNNSPPPSDFHALVVEENGRWLAALPLVSRRLAKILSAGSLTGNPWLPCGDLLLDPLADTDGVLSALAFRRRRFAVAACCGSTMRSSMRRVGGRLATVCRKEGIPIVEHARFQVAKIEIADNWDAFTKNLSRSHRQGNAQSRAAIAGIGRFAAGNAIRNSRPRKFIRGWKRCSPSRIRVGKATSGSSVLRTPGMSDFFLRQARQLAEWGQLEIALLQLEGHPIASLFGFSAKGVYHAHKIGYDPQYQPIQSRAR